MSADSLINEDGTIETKPQPIESNDGMSDDEARRQTKMLIDFRNSAQSLGISWFSDGDLTNSQAYEYKDWQKNKLVEAWTPIVAQYNLRLSPWANVIMCEMICTGPLVGLAVQNRKLRKQIESLKAQLQKSEEYRKSNEVEFKPVRTDSKTAWTIDQNGYFQYTPKGTYLKKEERNEKPIPTPEAYELLVKHNGKEFVDKALNISSQ